MYNFEAQMTQIILHHYIVDTRMSSWTINFEFCLGHVFSFGKGNLWIFIDVTLWYLIFGMRVSEQNRNNDNFLG